MNKAKENYIIIKNGSSPRFKVFIDRKGKIVYSRRKIVKDWIGEYIDDFLFSLIRTSKRFDINLIPMK